MHKRNLIKSFIVKLDKKTGKINCTKMNCIRFHKYTDPFCFNPKQKKYEFVIHSARDKSSIESELREKYKDRWLNLTHKLNKTTPDFHRHAVMLMKEIAFANTKEIAELCRP